MKKIIFLLLILFVFSSCANYFWRTYEVTYEIIYPDTTITYTKTFEVKMCAPYNECPDEIEVYSIRGSNYLGQKHQISSMVSSTCPIRVLYYERLK